MRSDNMPVFQRETALRVFLEEFAIRNDSPSYPLLFSAIRYQAAHPDAPLSESIAHAAAGTPLTPEQASRSIRKLLLNTAEDTGIPAADFIPYAAAWLLDTEKAYRRS